MSSGRRAEGVIGASATLGLIDYIQSHGGMVAPDELVENVAVLFRASRAKVFNTITLLDDLGIVEIRDEWVVSSSVVAGRDVLGARLVEYLVGQHLPPRFGEAMLLADGSDEVWVDAKRAPGRHLGIAPLLVELGVFLRERLTSLHWRIGDRYVAQFVGAVARANDAFPLRARSAEDLRQKMDEDLERGLSAERWVVTFEKSRLEGHPLREQIRRVSDGHADAGFDVLSFRDRASIAHNWLIEVKSFAEVPRFHWTANEIECARREGERYALYLVDRLQIHRTDYEPRIISGPYEFFFGPDSSHGWNMVADGYRVSTSP